MKDGAQFAAEPRRGRDVEKYLEAEAAIAGLLAKHLDQAVERVGVDGVEVDGCGVGDGLVDVERHRQTDGHHADDEAHPDELFDAVRLQRVPLPPLTVGGRAAMTSAGETDAHRDAAAD